MIFFNLRNENIILKYSSNLRPTTENNPSLIYPW